MSEFMKAVVYNAPWDMRLEKRVKPKPEPNEVLIKIQAVGICGSDVHGFTGESGRRTPGMVMGHEVAGKVVAHGALVQSPKIGTSVAIFNIIADVPPTPEEGDPSFLNKKMIGVNLAKKGAMAEFITVPAENALPIPEGVPPEIGLLAEPVAVVSHAWRRLEEHNINPQRVAIVGAGTIGLAAVLTAGIRKIPKLAVLDTIFEKTNRAISLGGKGLHVDLQKPLSIIPQKLRRLLGGEADTVVDAAGTEDSFALCLNLVKPGGSILLIGNLAKTVPLPLQDTVSKEISLIGTYAFNRRDFSFALSILPKIQSQLLTFIEGRCRLEDTPKTITALAQGQNQALKTIIDVD